MECQGKSPKITVSVVNQDELSVFFRVSMSSQMEKIMEDYCQRLSLDVDSVLFLYQGAHIQSNQTPNELGMVDEDKIYALYEQSSGRPKRNKPSIDLQESSRRKPRVKVENDETLEDNAGANSFSELDRATRSFTKAVSILKASILESNRLTEDARKRMEEVQSMTQSLDDIINAKIAAEKKVADRDMIIEQMNNDLQRANAEISTLSAQQSRLSKELLKFEKKLVEANKEVMKVCKEAEASKHSVALAKPQNKRKRAHAKDPTKIQPSAVVESCTVDADVDEGERSVGKEQKKTTDDSEIIYLQFTDDTGNCLHFKCPRSTQMLKVMQAYCSREQEDLPAISFKFNNVRIRKEQTPNELQLVDGDEIQVARKRMRPI